MREEARRVGVRVRSRRDETDARVMMTRAESDRHDGGSLSRRARMEEKPMPDDSVC